MVLSGKEQLIIKQWHIHLQGVWSNPRTSTQEDCFNFGATLDYRASPRQVQASETQSQNLKGEKPTKDIYSYWVLIFEAKRFFNAIKKPRILSASSVFRLLMRWHLRLCWPWTDFPHTEPSWLQIVNICLVLDGYPSALVTSRPETRRPDPCTLESNEVCQASHTKAALQPPSIPKSSPCLLTKPGASLLSQSTLGHDAPPPPGNCE